MNIHCITILATQPEPGQVDLKHLLGSQRMVSLQQRFEADCARTSIEVFRAHVQGEQGLRLKERLIVRPSQQGLQFCGLRIKPGGIWPGRRKQLRWHQAARRLQAAEAAGLPQAAMHRAARPRTGRVVACAERAHGTHILVAAGCRVPTIAAGCMSRKEMAGAQRAGSWNNAAGRARAAYRNDNYRGNDWNDNGFRFLLSSRARAVAPRIRQRPDLRGRASNTRCVGKLQGPQGAGRAAAGGFAPKVPRVFRVGVSAW